METIETQIGKSDGLRVVEEAVQFGESGSLVGVLTRPFGVSPHTPRPAYVILNSGIAHRVGTGRLYVRIARFLASCGYMSLRFDFSGVGDSSVRRDGLTFEESVVADTQQAMDYLQSAEGVERFVLTGICRGGDVSFQTASIDKRVAGIVLMNHSFDYGQDFWQQAASRSAARFVWKKALFSPSHWTKLIKGKINLKKAAAPIVYVLKAPFLGRKQASKAVAGDIEKLVGLMDRRIQMLLVYSEYDPGLDAFRMVVQPSLRRLETTESMRLEVLEASDHTFTLIDSQQRLLSVIGDWNGTLENGWAVSRHPSVAKA